MKMKNVWALLLASVMTVTMAAGCGNSEGEKKDTSADKSTSAISGEDTSDAVSYTHLDVYKRQQGVL